MDLKIKSIDNRGEKWYYALMKMSLRTFSIIIVSALLLTGIGIYLAKAHKPVENAVKGVQSQNTTPTIKREPADPNKIFELVNAERAKVGVAPLVSDQRLVATAQARADDMITRDYFSHYDPITSESLVKIKPTNPQCITASENIQLMPIGGDSNKAIVDWWLNSLPHKQAMLDPKYTLTGIVSKENKSRQYVSVQHFCQQ